MQTTKLITECRQLTAIIEDEVIEKRATGRASPDLNQELQGRLDYLTQHVKNPTLSCLLDLENAAYNFGLNTGALNQIIQENKEAWRGLA